MKKLMFAFLLTVCIVGCQSTSVFVWTARDVFGLCLLGLAVLIILFLFARAAILDFFASIKRKRKRNELNKKTR